MIVDDDGDMTIINKSSLPILRRTTLAYGEIMYDRLGTNTYQFKIGMWAGIENKVGTTDLYIDYGDNTVGHFTYNSISGISEWVYATTNTVKYYSPGTYTLKVTSGYIDIHDFLGVFVERITGSDLVLSIDWLNLTV